MTFEDAGLTRILREKVHTKVFKKEYLEWLTELELDRLPEDLEELKKLPNLTTLIIPQKLAGEKAGELIEAGYTVEIVPDGEVESP